MVALEFSRLESCLLHPGLTTATVERVQRESTEIKCDLLCLLCACILLGRGGQMNLSEPKGVIS